MSVWAAASWKKLTSSASSEEAGVAASRTVRVPGGLR